MAIYVAISYTQTHARIGPGVGAKDGEEVKSSAVLLVYHKTGSLTFSQLARLLA